MGHIFGETHKHHGEEQAGDSVICEPVLYSIQFGLQKNLMLEGRLSIATIDHDL